MTILDGKTQVQLNTKLGIVDVQNPIETDGDSVYVKDIDVENSSNGDFDGSITDYFDSLKTVNTNTTSDNPKIIKVWFNRTIQMQSIGFGCDNLGKSFSNIVVKALGSGEEVRYTKDESSDNTKRNSYLISLPPLALNGVQIEFHTADEVCLSNLIIFKAIDTNSRIKGVSELDGEVEDVSTFRNALKVDTAFVHKKGANLLFFQNNLASTTLASATTADDTSIDVVDSTGFVVGEKVRVTGAILTGQTFMTITNVVANTITLDRPIGSVLPIGSAIDEVTTELSVLGSLASPEIFRIQPPAGLNIIWQLSRLILSMTDSTTMDDGKFGGQTALTNGVNLRIVKGDGTIQSLTNWKTNGDIALDMYDVTYTDSAPAGENGLRGRWTFTKAEFIVELDGDAGDYLELRIQDDLTSLTSFQVKCQGRLLEST